MDLKTIQNLQAEIETLFSLLGIEYVTPSVEMQQADTINVELTHTQPENEEARLGMLIGNRGETLAALAYVLALMVNKDREEWVRVHVDIDGYRKRREEEVSQLARAMAERAIANHEAVELRPMSAADRRIVHMVIANMPEVASESQGEGRDRHIVIKPAE